MYMRRFVKRMAAAVLLSACLVSLSGCSSNQDTAETDSTISMDGTPVDDSMAQSIMLSAAQTLGVPKDQLIVQKTLAESTGDATTAAIYEAQLEVREDMGELKNVNMDEGSVVLLADGSYTVVIPVDFTEGTKKYVMNINMATQQIQAEFTDMSAGVEEDTSMGTLLKTATVYTVIGHLWNFTANCRIYPQFRLLGHKSREICLKQNNLSRTFVFYMLHVINPS